RRCPGSTGSPTLLRGRAPRSIGSFASTRHHSVRCPRREERGPPGSVRAHARACAPDRREQIAGIASTRAGTFGAVKRAAQRPCARKGSPMSNGRLFGSALASLIFGTACLLPACAVEAPDDPEEIDSAQSALAASPPTRVERCKNGCYYA